MVFSISSLTPIQTPLKIGSHKYFGKTIDVQPVRTLYNGLCYKLELSDSSIPVSAEDHNNFFGLFMKNLTNDELTEFHLTFAAKDTWQGMINGKAVWPYNKIPPKITGEIKCLDSK